MADYAAVLAELEERRTAVEAELHQLDIAIAAIRSVDQWAVPASASMPFRGMGLRVAVRLHMKTVGVPQTTADVIAAVRNGGLRSNIPRLDSQVYNALHAMKAKGDLTHSDDNRWTYVVPPEDESLRSS